MTVSVGDVLVHEIVAFLNDDSDFSNMNLILSLRLVCKAWNETFINSSDYWQQMMINNLNTMMKAKLFTENVTLPRFVCSRRKLMLKSIRNWFLVQRSITSFSSVHSYYQEEPSYVYPPAILNEFDNELVAEMIRLLLPNIFLIDWSISEGPYCSADSETEIIISNVQGKIDYTKLIFKMDRCDGTCDQYHFLEISFEDEGITILKNKHSQGRKPENFSDKATIKFLMQKVGLSEEMVNSELCYRDFLVAIYTKGLAGNTCIDVVERELIEY